MSSVFNHLIHPRTYTADNGQTRFLSSEDMSRVKNYVLAALVLAVIESLHSSRSLKSCVIIIVVTASGVFYIATAILKMLARGESAPSIKNADPAAPVLSRPGSASDSVDVELEKLGRDVKALERKLLDVPLTPAEIEERKQAARKLQDEQFHALLADARKAPPRSAAFESRPQQPAPQPVVRRDAPQPRLEPPSAPFEGLSLPPLLEKVKTAIFGEEDFSKKPFWVDDPQYQKGLISLQRAYFASLWKRMYGGGFDVLTHEMEFSENDEKLRKRELQIANGAPWASFAEHARNKLIEEWNKKSDFRKAFSPYIPFV